MGLVLGIFGFEGWGVFGDLVVVFLAEEGIVYGLV